MINNFVEIMEYAHSVGQYVDTINAFAQRETVTEGHAKICVKFGHGTWTVDGEIFPRCPRCGSLV